jgi:biotin carboxylase
MKELVILAHVPTDAINDGFIPAARRLGLRIVVVTDHADAHRRHFSRNGVADRPDEIVGCDVFNPLSVLGVLTSRGQAPAAVFSNSDHLQASTSIVAAYFGLPHKDWQVAYRAKNKAEMRRSLQAKGLDVLWHALVCDAGSLERQLADIPFPCIVKPREGVASQQVTLSHDAQELKAQCAAAWAVQAGMPLLLEEFIDGPLYTLETLGDGKRLQVLGGFEVKLSPPPYFVELEARWETGLDPAHEARVVEMIRSFGIGFGACHTEFVMTPQGPRLIEINYRNIGDSREFLLQDALEFPLFETVLRLYMGEALPNLALARNAARIRYYTVHAEGRLEQAPDAFVEQRDGVSLAYKPLRAAGERLSVTNSNKDYLGVLRGTAPDMQRLGAAMERISAQLAWKVAA